MTTPSSLPDSTHIGRIALRVTDLESMVGFSTGTSLGSRCCGAMEEGATLGVDNRSLLVLDGADTAARGATPCQRGSFTWHPGVPSRDALGDALTRVRETWQLAGASDHGVSAALYLTDPEGNGIEIYRDYPRADWPRDDEDHIQMGTYPLDLEPVAAAATGASALPGETDVGHVHLEVSSLSTFNDFYVDTVGFVEEASTPGARFVAAGGYHHHMWRTSANRRVEPVSGRGLAWFEVELPESETLDDLRRSPRGQCLSGDAEGESRSRSQGPTRFRCGLLPPDSGAFFVSDRHPS
ncbi:MAG: VOC family protein [Natrialbaceae archaeon]|nr:VOC family protein [Natrialbaceae archaeon]